MCIQSVYIDAYLSVTACFRRGEWAHMRSVCEHIRSDESICCQQCRPIVSECVHIYIKYSIYIYHLYVQSTISCWWERACAARAQSQSARDVCDKNNRLPSDPHMLQICVYTLIFACWCGCVVLVNKLSAKSPPFMRMRIL